MPAGIFCALIRKRKNKNKNNDLKINRGFFAIRYVFVRTYRKKKHPSSAAKCLHCCSGTIVTQCVAALYNAHWFQILRKMYGNKSPCPRLDQQ